MISNTRYLTNIGGFIVALLILTGCQPGNTAPESTDEILTVTEEIGETVVVIELGGAAQANIEKPPAKQGVDQPTEIATASPTDTLGPLTTYLGDVVESGGYLISATNVDYPADLENYSQPEDGEKLVAIDAIIGVTSGRSLIFMDFFLNDQKGSIYYPEEPLDREFGVPTKFQLNENHALVEAGEKVRWFVVFKIPDNAIPTKLKYVTYKYPNNILSIGLGAPPEGHRANAEILNSPPLEPRKKLGKFYDYSINAQVVKDPAEPLESCNLNPGEKLVAIDTIIENGSEHSFFSVVPINFFLIDNSGYLYPLEKDCFEGEVHYVDLLPGKEVRGWVAFRIPEEASPYILKLGHGIWVPDYYLQTRLIE